MDWLNNVSMSDLEPEPEDISLLGLTRQQQETFDATQLFRRDQGELVRQLDRFFSDHARQAQCVASLGPGAVALCDVLHDSCFRGQNMDRLRSDLDQQQAMLREYRALNVQLTRLRSDAGANSTTTDAVREAGTALSLLSSIQGRGQGQQQQVDVASELRTLVHSTDLLQAARVELLRHVDALNPEPGGSKLPCVDTGAMLKVLGAEIKQLTDLEQGIPDLFIQLSDALGTRERQLMQIKHDGMQLVDSAQVRAAWAHSTFKEAVSTSGVDAMIADVTALRQARAEIPKAQEAIDKCFASWLSLSRLRILMSAKVEMTAHQIHTVRDVDLFANAMRPGGDPGSPATPQTPVPDPEEDVKAVGLCLLGHLPKLAAAFVSQHPQPEQRADACARFLLNPTCASWFRFCARDVPSQDILISSYKTRQKECEASLKVHLFYATANAFACAC